VSVILIVKSVAASVCVLQRQCICSAEAVHMQCRGSAYAVHRHKASVPLMRCIYIIKSPLNVSHLKSFVISVVIFMFTRYMSEVMAELYEWKKGRIRGMQFISQQLNVSICRL
jgi:hypothetical protein